MENHLLGLQRFGAGIRVCHVLAALAFLVSPLTEGFAAAPPAEGSSGFCVDGVWGHTRWPDGKRPPNLRLWGSFCANGDADVGRLESRPFPAPGVLQLYLAGYPGQPGRRLIVRTVGSGEEMELRPVTVPGATWRLNVFALRREWVGKPVKLIAEDTATGIGGWLGFSQPLLIQPFSMITPAIETSGPRGGFCPDGVFHGTNWPSGVTPAGVTTWGSYCKSGDGDTGWAASHTAIAGPYLSIYLAGYPQTPGIRLAAENAESGEQLLLTPPLSPGAQWRQLYIPLPPEWIGQPVRVIAEDKATTGWIGFSEPLSADLAADLRGAIKTLAVVLFLAGILLLPPVAACVIAALRGITDSVDLTAVALLTLGLTGYAAFWAYFFHHAAGVLYSYATLGAACGVMVYAARAKIRWPSLLPLKPLIVPAALVVFAAIFIVSLGLLRGGQDAALELAPSRYAPPELVGDHLLPKNLADGLWAGRIPRPLMADWLSSDRPPLQAGTTIWTYPWTARARNPGYLASSVILQCSFLAGLWAFLTAAGIGHRPLGLAIAASFFSGFTFVQGFYTWPKLYPVAYLLLAAAYLLTERYHAVRDRAVTGAVVGLSVALAMLCHGGSMFGIVGIGGCLLLLRRFPGRRFLLSMAAAGLLAYLPWTLYQKLYDPPGDRLLKFHLAGVQEPHPEVSLANLVTSSYKAIGLRGAIDYKLSNFRILAADWQTSVDDLRILATSSGPAYTRDRAVAASDLRRSKFLFWVTCIGLANLGPVALALAAWLRRRNRAEFTAAWRLWLCIAVAIVFWCLLMFGPIAATVHSGTYLTVIMALAGACLAFWTLHPAVAVVLTGIDILCDAVLYIWATPPPPAAGGGSVIAALNGPVNVGFAAACVLSAAGMLAVLLIRFAVISQAEHSPIETVAPLLSPKAVPIKVKHSSGRLRKRRPTVRNR